MHNIRTKTLRATSMGLFFAMFASTLLAQSDPGTGEPRRPPKEAVQACKALTQDQACSFSMGDKKMNGTCWAPADKPLACRPKGAPAPGTHPLPKK